MMCLPKGNVIGTPREEWLVVVTILWSNRVPPTHPTSIEAEVGSAVNITCSSQQHNVDKFAGM